MSEADALTTIAALFATWLAWPCIVFSLLVIAFGLYIGGGVAWFTVRGWWRNVRKAARR